MKKNKQGILLGIVLVLILGIALESKAQQKEQPKMGGTLVFGLGKEPANPIPFIGTSSTNQFVKETTYESLLTQDDEGRIVPNLATGYEVSSGGTAITLRLRKGVKFHNGKEMKADDVVWSANHVRDPKNSAFGNNIIQDVKSVEKIDDYTVKFILSNPSSTFLFHLSTIRMLPIAPANSVQPGQVKLEKNAFIPGTGPFIFEQVQPGFDTILRKFPEYWGGPVYLDKIIFRPITDGTNRFNALRTGDVQMADRLAPLDIARVKKGEVKGLVIVEEPLGGFQHLIMNYRNPLFQKLEMRQALYYATDKQRLVDEVFFGHAVKTDLMMDPKGIWAKAANLPLQKRDLAKAKALLKAAGYTGQELALIGRKSAAQLMESYQRMIGEAGIKVKLEVLEGGVMNERVIQGKYDMNIDGGNITSDPVITMVPDYYSSKVERARYSNPKVDQLFDNLDKEFDETKRLRIFKELATTVYNDVATLPLFFEFRYVGMLEKVQGFAPPPGHSFTENGNIFKRTWLR